MNRFDRVTALFLLLQTRSVVTARFLAEHFNVSERTIYRDIRTLENAGVPIGAEAGVGYFLEKGYRLPPVSFTLNEAASLLPGGKLLVSSLDPHSLQDFNQALNKVRAVVDRSSKDHLSSLDADTEVLPTGSYFLIDSMNPLDQDYKAAPVNDRGGAEELGPLTARGISSSGDRWLRECRSALVRRQVVEIGYSALGSGPPRHPANRAHRAVLLRLALAFDCLVPIAQGRSGFLAGSCFVILASARAVCPP